VVDGKPAPDMIFKILEKTTLRPSETVMVGDSVSDMQMGRKAGVKACIGVLTGSLFRR
jgi:phosphoglycolate phosphatase